MSVRGDCQVDFAKLLLRQPFTGREASDGFEDTIEGRVVGKTRFQTYLRHFLFRIVAQQLLGVSHTVAIDELGERIAFTAVDAGRDLVLMHTELLGNVAHLQVAAQVKALLFHKCFNTLHQLIGRIHGIWFSEFVGGRLTDSIQPIPASPI